MSLNKITAGWCRFDTIAGGERGTVDGPKFTLQLWARLAKGVVHSLDDCDDDEVEAIIKMAAAMRSFNLVVNGCQPLVDGQGAGYAISVDELEMVAENLSVVVAKSEYHAIEPPRSAVWRDEDDLLHLIWQGIWTKNRFVELVIEHSKNTQFKGDIVTAVILRWDTATSKTSSYLGLPHGLKEKWAADWGVLTPPDPQAVA